MVTVPRQGAHSIDVAGGEGKGDRKNVYFTCMVLERHISGDGRFSGAASGSYYIPGLRLPKHPKAQFDEQLGGLNGVISQGSFDYF